MLEIPDSRPVLESWQSESHTITMGHLYWTILTCLTKFKTIGHIPFKRYSGTEPLDNIVDIWPDLIWAGTSENREQRLSVFLPGCIGN